MKKASLTALMVLGVPVTGVCAYLMLFHAWMTAHPVYAAYLSYHQTWAIRWFWAAIACVALELLASVFLWKQYKSIRGAAGQR